MAHAAQATRLEQCITAKHNQGVPASSSIANFTPPLQEGNTIFCIGGGQKLPLPLVVVRLLSFPRPGAPLIRELYAAECIRCRIEGVLLSILRRQEKYVACLRYFAFRRKTAGFRCNVEVSRAGRTLFGLVKNEPERAGAVGKDTGVETCGNQGRRGSRRGRCARRGGGDRDRSYATCDKLRDVRQQAEAQRRPMSSSRAPRRSACRLSSTSSRTCPYRLGCSIGPSSRTRRRSSRRTCSPTSWASSSSGRAGPL